MATGSLINPNKVINGTLTPYDTAESELSIKQVGQVVTINGFVRNATVGSNTQLGTISGVALPPEVIRTLGGVADQAYQHPSDVAYLTLGTNGNLSVTTTQTGTKAVYCSFSYIA